MCKNIHHNKTNPSFHGSDIEKIAAYFHIPMNSIANFGANVNPLGISEKVKSALADNLNVLSTYPDRDYSSLRQVMGNYCQVDPKHIMVGNGTSELIALLIEQSFPKKTLILGPTYSEYERELSFSTSTVEYYNLEPEGNFIFNLDDLVDKLSNNYDLLIICNPNNPTSTFIHNKVISEILTACKKHNTFVMIDETYVEFVPDYENLSSMSLIDDFDNFMVLRGVSKFFAAPGIRLGYGVTSNAILLQNMKNAQIPWSLNSIGAYAGEIMFADTSYIETTKTFIETEKRHILSKLNNISGIHVYEPYANFILVQIIKDNLTANEVFVACLEKGLLIRDCSSFQNLHGEFFRFCIMDSESNSRLLHALKDIFTE